MADNTTDTNTTDTDATPTPDTPTTPTPSNGTVLDLRPPADSIKAELVRLGLTYDHGPDPLPDGETWRDYQHAVIAVIPSQTSGTVTISDSATGIGKTVPLTDLKQVTRILTTKG